MLTKQPNDEINNPCEMLEKYSNDKRQERLKYCKEHLKTMGPGGKFCVSVFRQNQEYHIINVHDWGLFPLATAFPGGWDGMRAETA